MTESMSLMVSARCWDHANIATSPENIVAATGTVPGYSAVTSVKIYRRGVGFHGATRATV